ncbi:MAG: FAD:protein FMN transferase [Bacteroidota bacterium]
MKNKGRTILPTRHHCQLILLSGLVLVWSMPSLSQNWQRWTFEHAQMGTTFRIIIYGQDSLKVKAAAKAAFDRIDTLNAHMSDYIPGSELNRLSATAGTGQKITVSEDLFRVLALGNNIARASDGEFDMTLGKLSLLWRRAFRQSKLPSQDQIDEVRVLQPAYLSLKLYPEQSQVLLVHPNVRLDLGGIAKGYAGDAALQLLQERGFDQVLIDAGGDLVLGEAPPGSKGWRVEIPIRFVNGGLSYQKILLKNCAIATSGDTYRYLEWEGKRYSHIISPKTGWALTDRMSVTVIARTGTVADAWASAYSVHPWLDWPVQLSKEVGFVQRLQPNAQSQVRASGKYRKIK